MMLKVYDIANICLLNEKSKRKSLLYISPTYFKVYCKENIVSSKYEYTSTNFQRYKIVTLF